MALKITDREVDGVALLALNGRVGFGDEVNVLREKVKSLLAEGNNRIVLNLGNVTLIDSKGLGALVAAYYNAKSAGASLRLCNLGPRLTETLRITNLDTIFEVSNTEEDAVRDMARKASAD
jgi:anti-sigma B factor antagonist